LARCCVRGVYLLPDSEANRHGLQRLSEHMSRINGTAHILPATNLDAQPRNRRSGRFFDRAGKIQGIDQSGRGACAAAASEFPSRVRSLEFSTSSDVNSKRSAHSISLVRRQRSRPAQALRDTEGEVRKKNVSGCPQLRPPYPDGALLLQAHLGLPQNPSWPIGSPPVGSSVVSSTRRRA